MSMQGLPSLCRFRQGSYCHHERNHNYQCSKERCPLIAAIKSGEARAERHEQIRRLVGRGIDPLKRYDMKEKIIEVLVEVYQEGRADTEGYGFMENDQVMYAEQIFRIFGV